MEIIPWNPLQHPLLPTPVTPSQQNRWCWIFGRTFYTFQTKTDLILTQIQRWIWEKQLIKPKVQKLHYDYLLHTTPFHASFFHNLSMNTSHTQELTTFLTLHSPLPSPFPHTHNAFSLGKPPWPSLSLFPLSNESFEILLHQSMASSSFKGQWEFENEWPSNWN